MMPYEKYSSFTREDLIKEIGSVKTTTVIIFIIYTIICVIMIVIAIWNQSLVDSHHLEKANKTCAPFQSEGYVKSENGEFAVCRTNTPDNYIVLRINSPK